MTIECPKCRTNNPDESKFCKECATPLPQSEDIKVPTKTIQFPKAELTTGSTFAGRYQIIEELGRGGMGRVYKAVDSKIHEKIALKLIKPEIASDKKTIERFGNELKFSRKISHRNVCRMYDLGEEQGSHYITMEYVAGEDLKSMLRMMGRMSPAQTVFIGKQICDGLVEAHRLGIIHRDLKPNNIMIDREGSARVMDFGIARSLKTKGMTGSGIMIGTPEYMSPEQAEAKDIDFRSDIYSLGVIFYEMVTGELPFQGDTPLSVAMKHKGEKPRDPREINAQIPEDLSGLILKCLAKEKDDRYQSAGEIRSELERIEKGLPTTSKVIPKAIPSTSREITVSFQPKKLLFPALAVFSLILVIVLLLLFIPGKKTVPIPTDKPSLAVLYFENNSGDETLENWRSGLSEMMITDLSQSKFLHILSGDRIFSLLDNLNLLENEKYSAEDLKKVASQGGVSHILRGSFITAGEKFIINVSLMRTDTTEVVSSIQEDGLGEISITESIDRITTRIKSDLNLTEEQVSGDIDRELSQITSQSPEAYKLFAEGRKIFYQGDPRASIPYFERATAADPEFAMAYRALAISYSNLGLLPIRDEYIKRAMELKERLPDRDRYLIEGDYFRSSERTYDRAIPAYKKALELYPDDTTINHNLALLYYDLEEWEKAILYYERAVKAKTAFAPTFRQLAEAYRAVGQSDKAEAVLESGLEYIGNKSDIYLALADHFLLTGKEERALAAVEESLLANPANLLSYSTRGKIYMIQGDLKKAEEDFWTLLGETEPGLRYNGFNGLIDLSLRKGQFKQAKDFLLRAITLAMNSGVKWPESEWRSTMSHVHIQTENYDEAVKESQKAFQLAVDADEPYLQRRAKHLTGLAYVRNNGLIQAEQIAQELKKLIDEGSHKKSIRLYYHLQGEIELKKRNYQEAVNSFQKTVSLALNQDDVLFSSSLAQAYYLAGQHKKAQEEYTRILNLRSGVKGYGDLIIKSYYMLGTILKELGQKEDAIQNYEKFLELWKNSDPDLPDVKDARKRLAGLRGDGRNPTSP
ncbi:MAG: protein kinase [Candidatus Aminicenantes bacterium]|nr:protein kinase [Candidatus Aminicenantes bacterium]